MNGWLLSIVLLLLYVDREEQYIYDKDPRRSWTHDMLPMINISYAMAGISSTKLKSLLSLAARSFLNPCDRKTAWIPSLLPLRRLKRAATLLQC